MESDAAEKENESNQVPGRLEIIDDSDANLVHTSYPMQFLADFAGAVPDNETGELLGYRHLIKRPRYKKYWGFSFGNEIGRLAQGMPGRNTGTNTIAFIHKKEVPDNIWKDVAYSRIVCNMRPQKE